MTGAASAAPTLDRPVATSSARRTSAIAASVVAACVAGLVARAPSGSRAAPACGFAVPGASPLWSEQSASLFAARDEHGTVVALWPALPTMEPIRMPFLVDAVDALDRAATTAPVLGAADVERARELRARMVPHVVRGLVPDPDGDAAVAALARRRGTVKASRDAAADGFMSEYYGGREYDAELRDFIRGGDDGYWLSCVPSAGGERAGGWAEGLARRLEAHALLGLRRSAGGRMCARVSRGASRVQIHSDGWHNMLVQLGAARRGVLLWMPDTVDLLGVDRALDDDGAPVPTSRLDPRRADDAPEGFRRAPTLVATLRPGDALHIPAAWFHYVEVGDLGATSPDAAEEGSAVEEQRPDGNGAPLSVGVNIHTVPLQRRQRGSFVEVPCAREAA